MRNLVSSTTTKIQGKKRGKRTQRLKETLEPYKPNQCMEIFWNLILINQLFRREGGNTGEGREGKEKATVEI